MNESLKKYIEEEIMPLYDHFDAAHQRDHADMVIRQSLEIAKDFDVDIDMVYTIAAYHDTGLRYGRSTHHLGSARIVRADERLKEWFTADQIETIAQAVEDHRASAKEPPRSLYGKIVTEADRFIDADSIVERTLRYGLDNYPFLDKEGHWHRALDHLQVKYGDGGYLRLWFENSPNVPRLEALRALIRDEAKIHAKFEEVWARLTGGHNA